MKIHQHLDEDICHLLIQRFNKVRDASGVSKRQVGDHRIFGFERFIPNHITETLFALDAQYIKDSCGRNVRYQTLMANHTFMEDGALGSGEGWHRDSVMSRQFKTIFYLVPVNEDNGPFRIFTNKSLIMDYGFRMKRRLSDFSVRCAELLGAKKEILLSDKAGFGFSSNTNKVHRGSKILKGERYAITVYSYLDSPDENVFKLANSDLI